VLALLYDIHGNLPALEAVLADAEQAGATKFVLGGDYALFGPWPEETLQRLHQLDATWIRGNGERWTAGPADAPDDELVQGAIGWCRESLGEGMVESLAALPEQYVTGQARYCHASPVSDVRTFLPEPGDDEDQLLAGVVEDRLVFGHSHVQFRRMGEGGAVELVNPGSVGMPFDGDQRAGYALMAGGGDLELRRVAYDHEASAEAARERLPEFGETIARRISQAAFAV
jgi:diadenosine tetraphosphatase ApaH/serine/threonine PP2A family protein phosphatase